MSFESLPSKYLTFGEFLEFLKIKASKGRSMIFKKEIPFIKIGRLIRFDREDIVQWIESKKEKQS